MIVTLLAGGVTITGDSRTTGTDGALSTVVLLVSVLIGAACSVLVWVVEE